MWNDESKSIIEMILNNIKLLKSVKHKLTAVGNLHVEKISCPGIRPHLYRDNDTIIMDVGLCHTLNLFDLAYVNFTIKSDDLHKLGRMFLVKKGIFGKSSLYPVSGDEKYTHCYMNPQRWEYLDFVEKQMQHVLEHGCLSTNIGV